MSRVALFIDPVTRHFERDRLFEADTARLGGDNVLGAWIHLRSRLEERGIPVHTADLLASGEQPAADVNVYLSFGIRHRYPKLEKRDDVVLSGFFALECPVVEPRLYRDLDAASRSFKRMFSFSDGTSLRPFLRAPLDFRQFRLPQPFDDVDEHAWRRGERRFLAMINANKLPRISLNELYTERLRAVEYFQRFGEIDLYGVGWDRPPVRVGATWEPATLRRLRSGLHARWERRRPSRDPLRVAALRAYRGPADSKSDVLGGYTFAVCFENMILSGWVTEKIFDCLRAGTVPVYLGAPDIERWVPRDCFVDMREFGGYDELRARLRSMSPAEIAAYREAGREYLRSEQYRPFTKQAFAELVGGLIEEDAGVSL